MGCAGRAVHAPWRRRHRRRPAGTRCAHGTSVPLLTRADALESSGAPVWSPDGAWLLFQREDLRLPRSSYAFQAQVRYPARIEAVSSDGSGRWVVVEDGLQPALSPSGAEFAYIRSSAQGTALLMRSVVPASPSDERVLVPPAGSRTSRTRAIRPRAIRSPSLWRRPRLPRVTRSQACLARRLPCRGMFGWSAWTGAPRGFWRSSVQTIRPQLVARRPTTLCLRRDGLLHRRCSHRGDQRVPVRGRLRHDGLVPV